MLDGRVAIVTGGNSGIGRAAALALARAGARVVIAARREPEGAAVVAEIEAAGGAASFVRTDVAKEMGLYAPMVVGPSGPSYWPPVDRQLTITLDDMLIEDGRMAPFQRSGPNFVAMGRFGNVMLVNGETDFSGEAAVGEVVRLYLVNTANTRIFNFALRGTRMKLVGGDSGRYEREAFVEEVLLSPSERAVVDVLFDTPGDVLLEHRTPNLVYELGSFSVAGNATGDTAASFEKLRSDPELTAERQSISHDIGRAPDKTLAVVASMPLLYGVNDTPASVYACPMHPEVTSSSPGTCPKCGMRLVPSGAGPVDWTALRWHLFLWDPWFLSWGLLLGVAAWHYTRLSTR